MALGKMSSLSWQYTAMWGICSINSDRTMGSESMNIQSLLRKENGISLLLSFMSLRQKHPPAIPHPTEK